MDLDDDYAVSRVEVAAWFKSNEGTICRPYRDEIEAALDAVQLKSLDALFNFLDADQSTIINADDVPAAFTQTDTNLDQYIDRAELKRRTDEIVSDMCLENAKLDRDAFLRSTRPKTGTKVDLFALLDADGDGRLEVEEYKSIYRAMDTNKDITVSTREAQAWVVRNLDTICGAYRA